MSRWQELLLILFLPATLAAEGITVTDSWIRATPPGATAAAGYLVLQAASDPDRLLDAHTPAAREVQIHEMIDDAGLMKMQRLPAIDLAPEAMVRLEPGKTHLMLIGLDDPLRVGDSVVRSRWSRWPMRSRTGTSPAARVPSLTAAQRRQDHAARRGPELRRRDECGLVSSCRATDQPP